MFNALIHNNPALSGIEKFNYLIASLEGQPQALVRNLPLTAANYTVAYNTFVERYSNKRLRAQAHWLALENISRTNMDGSQSLRNLLDTFSENVAALTNLNFPTEHWDFVLLNLMLKKLDNEIVTRFELQHGSSEVPSYKSLTKFLNKCCTAFDSISFGNQTPTRKVASRAPISKSSTLFISKTIIAPKCQLCGETHSLYNCSSFHRKTPQQGYELAKSSHLCFNCLSSVHSLSKCKSKSSCRKCNRRHHTLLHLDSNLWVTNPTESSASTPSPAQRSDPAFQLSNANANATENTPDNETMKSLKPKSLLCAYSDFNNQNAVLLSTALVEIGDIEGNYHVMRCLLDCGSMTSFITRTAASKLGLSRQKRSLQIKGIGSC